ncbi:hypothetical protein ACN27F_30205 [Solwaraspora sp. WMMB335]|uniref:hypothetical protein n=1 Tax=Solwaraspora sp. WMMB335 TaxID=3404118 RepID=UPI003B929C2C
MAGRMVAGATALAAVAAGLVEPASAPELAGVDRVLPVPGELTGLLPGRGLRRGSTVNVLPSRSARLGATSLLLALLAGASRSGLWCAVVGVPALGTAAAAELGIALDRLALVPNPGPDWPAVVAALIDGVDVVVVAAPAAVAPQVTGRLAARARQRGCVLVPCGRWDAADVTLQVVRGRWEGLGQGRGRLRRREMVVSARGRGALARPREIRVWLPGGPPPAAVQPAAVQPAAVQPAAGQPSDVQPATGGGSQRRARRAELTLVRRG